MTHGGYPALLDLVQRSCVIVGGGKVAARKVDGLLAAAARVTVISPALVDTLRPLVGASTLTWDDRAYAPGMLAPYAPFLVIAATDTPEVNRAVAGEARELGALVNVADGSAASDFSNMVTWQQPPLLVALSTGGASPALAQHLLQQIQDVVGPEYATLARWLDDLRPLIRQHVPAGQTRAQFWHEVVTSEALAHLRAGQIAEARAIVDQLAAGVLEGV